MRPMSIMGHAKAVALTTTNDLTLTEPDSATTLTMPYEGSIRITVMLDTASILYLRYNSVNGALNSGAALAADCWYTFELGMLSQDTISFRIGTNCTFRLLVVEYAKGA